jgi:phage FluMu protein Com
MTSQVIEDMALPVKDQFRPFRCTRCGRMLCLEAIGDGAVKIKCPRCKNVNVLAVRPRGEEED